MRLITEAREARLYRKFKGTITTSEVLNLIERLLVEYDKNIRKKDKFHLLYNCAELAFAFYSEMPFAIYSIQNWYKILLQRYPDYMCLADQNLCISRMEELSRFSTSLGKPILAQMHLHTDSMQTSLLTSSDEQCLQLQQRLVAFSF